MTEWRVTVLVENTASRPNLLAEHGLSVWIELAHRRILFDTGAGAVLWSNARQLGIRLELADAIVLSHGHYDHTGGLTAEDIAMFQMGTHPALTASPIAYPLVNAAELAIAAMMAPVTRQAAPGVELPRPGRFIPPAGQQANA